MTTTNHTLAALLSAALVVSASPAQAQTTPGPNTPSVQLQYQAGGQLKQSTDAAGRSRQYHYDSLNRLRRSTEPSTTPSNTGPSIQTDYNPAGALTRITDPRGLSTQYNPDGLGQTLAQHSPDTGHTQYVYDRAGNLISRIDERGIVTTYSYDALGRLTRAAYSDGSSTEYQYDQGPNGLGRLSAIQDPQGIESRWAYDPTGRIVTHSQTLPLGRASGADRSSISRNSRNSRQSPPLSLGMQYSYAPQSGQRITTTYPSGKILSYRYAPASQALEAISFDGQRVAEQIRWHPSLSQGPGAVSGMLLANNTYWSSRLDTYGRIISYSLGGQEVNLAWDQLNRLIAQDSNTSAYRQSYSYDPLDRLAGFESAGRSQGFVYDLNGNLLDKTDRVGSNPEQHFSYSIASDSNRLTHIESLGIGYGFDAAGNRTHSPSLTHTYDARGRLVKTELSQGGRQRVYQYWINALGQRVAKTGADGTTIYVYDQDGQLIGEYDALGRPLNEYIWLPTQNGTGPSYRPIAVVQYSYKGNATTASAQNLYAIETDHLGSPRRIADSQNQTRWHWNPAPYGDTQPNNNPQNLGAFTLNLRFAGQYFDKETNLYYNHHRDYESTTGRYIQSDPIGLAGGINTYAYVGSNPLLWTDPEGLAAAGRAVGELVGTWGGRAVGGGLGAATPVPGGAAMGSVAGGMLGRSVGGALGSVIEDALCSPDPDPCKQLNDDVKRAKDKVSQFSPAACNAGMSQWELQQRHSAWLELATARAKRDQKCWGGGDDGHQQAQASAWTHVAQCAKLLQ